MIFDEHTSPAEFTVQRDFEALNSLIGHLYEPEEVAGINMRLYHTALRPLTIWGGSMRDRIEEPVQPRTINRRLKLPAIIPMLVDKTKTRQLMEDWADVMPNIYYIAPFSEVSFAAGESSSDISIPYVAGVSNCLGVVIKDGVGNVTCGHYSIYQQYNLDTVMELVRTHQSRFGNQGMLKLAASGMVGADRTLKKLDEISIGPVKLRVFDIEELQSRLAIEFPQEDIRASLFSTRNYPPNSTVTYHMITSTDPQTDIFVRRLDLDNREP